jgi:hypothetical protein
MLQLTWAFPDAASLRMAVEGQIINGRAFVPGAGPAEERAQCELVLDLAGRTHSVRGEVVFVRADEPGRGLGLALGPLDEATKTGLRAFVEACEAPPPSLRTPAFQDGGFGELDALKGPPVAEPAAQPDAQPEAPREEPTPESVGEDVTEGSDGAARMHERLRHLTGGEQLKVAATGNISERVMLERLYGPTVWETLLKNARITPPEVARMAKKGTLPRPLLDFIGANGAWLGVGEVQRALLSNHRTSAGVVTRILTQYNKTELLRVTQNTAYPPGVRGAAKRMLGGT